MATNNKTTCNNNNNSNLFRVYYRYIDVDDDDINHIELNGTNKYDDCWIN